MISIRQQLTRKLTVGFALLLGLGGAVIYFSTRTALLDEFDAALGAQATTITTLTKWAQNKLEVEVPDRLATGFKDRSVPVIFEMWGTNGIALARSESLGGLNLLRPDGPSKEPIYGNITLPSGAAGRAVGFWFQPEQDEDEGEGEHADRRPAAGDAVFLIVAADRSALDETLATLGLVLGATGLLLLLGTGLVVPRVLRRELAPLDQLAEQAAGITAESLGTRFPTETLPGELTPISCRLNDLLGRLEQAFERERRFSADLAHELRTPIAELRSFAELALKWPEAREAQTDREVLGIALQMEGMVTRLLALLRSEHGRLPVTREPVVPEPLVTGLWKGFAERAATKQLRFACQMTGPAELETDPVLLRSILTNLLDNAVEYTPCGDLVELNYRGENDRFTFQVANTTEHLIPADVNKLFDRFWRKDAARSNNEHSGLGLSLSKAFAQVLGLELTAALDGESRLIITLSGNTGTLHQPEEGK